MSDDEPTDGVEFDLEDILEDDVVEEISIDDIEIEDSSTDSDEEDTGSGESFQDKVREYMEELEDETFHDTPPVTVDEPELPTEVEELTESVVATEEVKAEVERRIMSASEELDTLVRDVVQQDSNSLAATEIDIMEAKKFLSLHKLRRAKSSVKNAEKALVT